MKIYKLEIWGFSILICLIIISIGICSVIDNNHVIKKISTSHKVVAITIDDGPNYRTTPEILSMLRDKKVRLTLFVLGQNAEKHPEILSQAAGDGHEIGNHGYSHKLMTKMSSQEYEKELDLAESIIMKAAPKPTLFRPPGGAYHDGILAEVRKRGYNSILWCIDPGDWRRPPVHAVVNNVMQNVEPGSIVLLHDGQYPLPTAKALGIIIDKLREQGYKIVTVSELLTYQGK